MFLVANKYECSEGYQVCCVEEEMMIAKAAWCYAKDGESGARKDDLVQQAAEKMLRAQKLQEEALAAGEELPKFARDPERWQGYLKFLGRRLPWQDIGGHDWQELHASGFHKDMQLRKCSSDDLWCKALLLAIEAGVCQGLEGGGDY